MEFLRWFSAGALTSIFISFLIGRSKKEYQFGVTLIWAGICFGAWSVSGMSSGVLESLGKSDFIHFWSAVIISTCLVLLGITYLVRQKLDGTASFLRKFGAIWIGLNAITYVITKL